VNALPSCQLCGSSVNINGAVAKCLNCGAEYDVIVHSQGRRDFSKSPEVSLNAQKKPTAINISLLDTTLTQNLAGKTLFVGTRIFVSSGLHWIDAAGAYHSLWGKRHIHYHRVNTGAWEKIHDAITGSSSNELLLDYTITKAGTHTFYSEFLGDDEYLGCPSTVHGLMVAEQHYAVSPEVSLEAAYALTVIVKDMIFKKPIEGARVVIDTSEAFTDSSGMATFDTLAPGIYTLSVSARDYKSETRKVELTELGKVVEIHLLHVAAIALGIVGAGAVGVVVVHQALKRRK